ncbi:5'/3'-nucleotidase SurE [Altererythrobacter sp. BO-6]|uniref:5'/3'-nucleotidase SurE n=1 Tax=Altererythrobacter sp. BO-6 TaxID=2604537 RepID=UPI002408227D|nr:5'/3'-nucleotidase SurE [Altererythrobacter sp. BO-6]
MTRDGLGPDFFYVNGTPVMALLYGLDIKAQERWGRPPDLVLSGPNEGRNTGYIVVSSGTVSNAQYAAMRGIPAIALSAGEDTRDNVALANPKSREVAGLAADFVDRLVRAKGEGPVMPMGTALNVNFPDDPGDAQWSVARIGTFNRYSLKFVTDLSQEPSARAYGLEDVKLPGVSVSIVSTAPAEDQNGDEAAVSERAISVSVMQIAYDGSDDQRDWLASTMAAMSSSPCEPAEAACAE